MADRKNLMEERKKKMFLCKAPSLKLNSEAWASATEQKIGRAHV